MSEPPTEEPDRVSRIIDCLNDPTIDELPDSLKFKYTDGFNMEKLEEELESHPFFMTELPDPSKPLPPLLEAFQQLKYSETDNTPHELACNYKEDGLFHFKIKKYRIAAACFTTAIGLEGKGGDVEVDNVFLGGLYNNRSACMWFIGNWRSCVRDCEMAMKLVSGYFKAFKRCVSALIELERWEEVEGKCKGWGGVSEVEVAFVMEARGKARKGKAKVGMKERKGGVLEKKKKEMMKRVLEVVKGRGIKVGDENFVFSEAAEMGRVVKIEDGGGLLAWPVLLMYPQYSLTDFIEAFKEVDSFTDHLEEMLDKDPPSWDVDKEYKSSNVELYYLNCKLIKVDTKRSLLDIMKDDTYVLPGNGVPSFFVLAAGNPFCEDFKERVESVG